MQWIPITRIKVTLPAKWKLSLNIWKMAQDHKKPALLFCKSVKHMHRRPWAWAAPTCFQWTFCQKCCKKLTPGSWAAQLTFAWLMGEYNSTCNWNWFCTVATWCYFHGLPTLAGFLPSLIRCRAEAAETELILGRHFSGDSEGKGAWHRGKTSWGSWGSSCCSIPLPPHACRGSPALHGANSTFVLGGWTLRDFSLPSRAALITARELEWSWIPSFSPR